MVFRTRFNLLFILIEIIVYIFIIVVVPWGFGLLYLNGYETLMQLPKFFRAWIMGFFLFGGFMMSGVLLLVLTRAGRDSLKKSIRRIQVGRK